MQLWLSILKGKQKLKLLLYFAKAKDHWGKYSRMTVSSPVNKSSHGIQRLQISTLT